MRGVYTFLAIEFGNKLYCGKEKIHSEIELIIY